MNSLYLVSGSANPALALEIARTIDIRLKRMDKQERFADGEWRIRYGESMRGSHVVIIQSTCAPVNDHLVELLLMIDAAKRAGADKISAVIPYFGYARQDRKDKPRSPISAAAVCSLLRSAGATRLLSLDLHAEQIQGFFDGPFDNLFFAGALLRYFQTRMDWGSVTLISPDAGGVPRCRAAANILGCEVGFINKYRPEANTSEVVNMVGNIQGRIAIFLDDMCDTAGTLVGGAEAVLKMGATHVYAACTHAVLSGNAVERIASSPIEELVVSDTIPIGDRAHPKIRVISASDMLSRMVRGAHKGNSLTNVLARSFDWSKSSEK